ncbi:acetate/propionate family kinase [Telmatospirillum sp. J64-1]|uniref:acetate/propionate family kinase n=1 Tax=Telmatospirillum sp. J64-1 TaxID=2502183 RepID=UPI00115EBBD1|nr:acetate/propionate family kinase [Telmatospirillum sp. J64-1]
MSKGILVINAGSSSIKFSLYLTGKDGLSAAGGQLRLASKGQVEGMYVAPRFVAAGPDGVRTADHRWDDPKTSHEVLLRYLLDWVEDHLDGAELVAAGHRVVHGGTDFTKPTLVTPEVLEQLEKLVPLAPLHQSYNLSPICALAKIHPDLPQVACFDTAFHRSNPAVAQTFALPRELTEEGVRRYGFHGLSYEYIAGALHQYDARAAEGRVVVAHLGSGASMCALKGGRSHASTMGFTALEGLPMGTRSGSLDVGVVFYLLEQKGMSVKDIESMLYKKSGLLGVSGVSNDMRVLMASDDPRAREAVDLFVYRICRELGSLTAAVGGLDALVFTAGIGQNSREIRALVCEQAAWLGIDFDAEANEAHGPRISTPDSPVSVWVIPTDEELMIATHTRKTLAEATRVAA